MIIYITLYFWNFAVGYFIMEVRSLSSFSMELAGAVVCVYPLFQSTREYCRAYLSDMPCEFSVRATQQDLLREQKILEQEALEEGLKIRKFADPFLERSFIQRRVADRLVDQDTLMLHGSTVAVDGSAYLFTAPCGTGKSTHTRLWREVFGHRAVMVNDDKPFLRITSEGVMAYGSPWSGKHGLASNVVFPLKGICLLRRGPENVIRSAAPEELMDILLQQVHMPTDASLAAKTRSLLETLAATVSLWDMHCNKEPDAARVAYCAMSSETDI